MNIEELLNQVYPQQEVEVILKGIADLTSHYKDKITGQEDRLTERDVILITYGDQIHNGDEAKLKTLKKFLDDYLKGFINSVHILPFYPYTSDDGFSVVDYYAVNPDLGSWQNIEELAEGEYNIMFDAVINHISQESSWFKGFLKGQPEYANYFIEERSLEGWENVVRPRTSPLLHEFEDSNGQNRNIWTTFSRDQVDLNYKNPEVLLHIIDLLLFYISKGAGLIRLDAIGFMWKTKNTSCIHLNETHQLIKVMRAVIEQISPSTVLITETNVPHKENISYFGNGTDEAHMVYNFTLPPLMALGLLKEDASHLTNWARSLELPSDKVCFFNFGSSHDGVGLRPLDGILDKAEIDLLLQSAKANGGFVSYKSNADGTESPYEINCNYFSLLKGAEVNEQNGIARMLLAHGVILAMPGVPGIYFHSLVGSENYHKGVEETGRYRTINREKLEDQLLRQELSDQGNLRTRIFSGIKRLIEIRIANRAFDPFGEFSFPILSEQVFAIHRKSPDGLNEVLALFNFSGKNQEVKLPNHAIWTDLINGAKVTSDVLSLKGYQISWLSLDQ